MSSRKHPLGGDETAQFQPVNFFYILQKYGDRMKKHAGAARPQCQSGGE